MNVETMKRYTGIFLITLTAVLTLTSVTSAQQKNWATSKLNMVATVNPVATDAGVAALDAGGNAVDAAIASALTLGVVDGFNSGIGGGCFILIHTADGKVIAIDGRETAPQQHIVICTFATAKRTASFLKLVRWLRGFRERWLLLSKQFANMGNLNSLI